MKKFFAQIIYWGFGIPFVVFMGAVTFALAWAFADSILYFLLDFPWGRLGQLFHSNFFQKIGGPFLSVGAVLSGYWLWEWAARQLETDETKRRRNAGWWD